MHSYTRTLVNPATKISDVEPAHQTPSEAYAEVLRQDAEAKLQQAFEYDPEGA